MSTRPNVLLILNDDMGYSDLGCYGGEIETPNLDQLAANGIRFTQFYNTARCSPSRASLLTGLHPHQTGIGVLTDDDSPDGYPGNLNDRCVTLAEVLKWHGYQTYMSGKWHVAHDFVKVTAAWPRQRGFDHFYGTLAGAGSYYDPNTLTRDNENIEQEAQQDPNFYYTDAISDNAVRFLQKHVQEFPGAPFFQYVAYTSPHWPLHAREEDIQKYRGRFDDGWDRLREQRMERMIEMGILNRSWKLSDRDPTQPAWELADHKSWRLRCMEVYAAQIEAMDRGIGQIVRILSEQRQLANTVIFFLADNGACAEVLQPSSGPALARPRLIARLHTRQGEPVCFGHQPDVMPGPEDTYQSYGVAWANLSNTPFRLYKHWVHEGGISTPLIIHWPNGIEERGSLRHSPGQLPDIMATVLEITGAEYPAQYNRHDILPQEGNSLVPLFSQDTRDRGPLFWEHEGNSAVRTGHWKLVRKYPGSWELYDVDRDRTELSDLAAQHPERVTEMSAAYEAWAKRCGVIPREQELRAIEARVKKERTLTGGCFETE